ncbi:hypothetical protein SAMN05428978_103926, partial [Nitrosomonas sp. Nm34]
MARVASGKEVLEQAKTLLVNARTIEELKQAQAVVLPLELGLSMDFLAPFIEKAAAGGILIVSEIKQALDARLNRKTSLAATYNLL